MCCDKKLGVHHTVKYNICVAARARTSVREKSGSSSGGGGATGGRSPGSGLRDAEREGAFRLQISSSSDQTRALVLCSIMWSYRRH